MHQNAEDTPETEATTPDSPLEDDFSNDPFVSADDGYLGDPEEVRERRRLRRSQTTGVSRRSTRVKRPYSSYDDLPSPSSSEHTSSDSSPDRPRRKMHRPVSSLHLEETRKGRRFLKFAKLRLMTIVTFLSIATMYWTYPVSEEEMILAQYEKRRHYQRGRMTSGLRGKLVQMAGRNYERSHPNGVENNLFEAKNIIISHKAVQSKLAEAVGKQNQSKNEKDRSGLQPLKFNPPPPIDVRQSFELQDSGMYRHASSGDSKRIVTLGDGLFTPAHRTVALYPAEFTDNTQFYGMYDSDDERLSHMEVRQPLEQGECVPMQEWQTTYHPFCNGVHELGMEYLGDGGDDFMLFGTKGFWRNAWKVDLMGGHSSLKERESFVLKTLKFEHNFEDAHFEHDRIDAVAMERLTSSPHVINVFGFCGHSVMTEYADGSGVGTLADKSKKKPLARLKIARDIAMGLADVHGIDGDGNSTFVHLDINPANVVSIGGTLKLNDFNIGILKRWNTTSNQPCGFPAQYPNPQWRSPEEARNEQNLTEKVDVFSMGHIFFRLICGHEPWNKLEIGGRPTKEEIDEKVKKGILPNIPEEILSTSDKEVQGIRDAMIACYTADPNKRPSSREIASNLQNTLKTLEKSTIKIL